MEENKKGQNTLYAVIGVATLIVAIIGATFAYFSAQVTAGNGVSGGTNNIAASLSVEVQRVLFGETAVDGDTYSNLVPAVITMSEEGIGDAINNSCVVSKASNAFTGCHLYKITASATQDVNTADLVLSDFTTSATDKASWKYVVFTATENDTGDPYTVTRLITGDTAPNFDDGAAVTGAHSINVDENAESISLTAYVTQTYYLLIYLENTSNVQNPTADDTDNAGYSATGTYSGSVKLNASSRNIVADFTSTG